MRPLRKFKTLATCDRRGKEGVLNLTLVDFDEYDSGYYNKSVLCEHCLRKALKLIEEESDNAGDRV
jgi:hypothetical protein